MRISIQTSGYNQSEHCGTWVRGRVSSWRKNSNFWQFHIAAIAPCRIGKSSMPGCHGKKQLTLKLPDGVCVSWSEHFRLPSIVWGETFCCFFGISSENSCGARDRKSMGDPLEIYFEALKVRFHSQKLAAGNKEIWHVPWLCKFQWCVLEISLW